jgi:regulator of protease activity HflC (stomatin/prohibitin superfamily)
VNPSLVFAIAVVSIVLLAAARSAILVPEQHPYVVERLGRYDKTLVTDARKASYQTADHRAAADAWGIAVIRYEMTDISRHNKESAA